MRVNAELISHLEELSALTLSEDEKRRLAGDLEEILGYMARLSELGAREAAADSGIAKEGMNCFREDAVKPSLEREKLLKNAPKSENGTFIAPRTV